MTRVAITGARGFLGRYVTDELGRHGYSPIELGRNSDGIIALCTDPHQTDLVEIFRGSQAVVHLAGVLVDPRHDNLTTYLGPNVGLTDQVAYAAYTAGVDRLVFTSSRLVYPPTLGRDATESDAAPDNPYGLSKILAERVLDMWALRTGGRPVSLRVSQVIGAGDSGRGLIAAFADAARAGRPLIVEGDGAAIRDYVDARDVARAIRLAIEHDAPPPVLNIGGGGHSIRRLAELSIDAFGQTGASVELVPVEHPDASGWSLDCTLAAETIGWQPAIDLVTTLRERVTIPAGDASNS